MTGRADIPFWEGLSDLSVVGRIVVIMTTTDLLEVDEALLGASSCASSIAGLWAEQLS